MTSLLRRKKGARASSPEEQRILVLLESGKIGKDDAAELLSALHSSSSPSWRPPGHAVLLLLGVLLVAVSFSFTWLEVDISAEANASLQMMPRFEKKPPPKTRHLRFTQTQSTPSNPFGISESQPAEKNPTTQPATIHSMDEMGEVMGEMGEVMTHAFTSMFSSMVESIPRMISPQKLPYTGITLRYGMGWIVLSLVLFSVVFLLLVGRALFVHKYVVSGVSAALSLLICGILWITYGSGWTPVLIVVTSGCALVTGATVWGWFAARSAQRQIELK